MKCRYLTAWLLTLAFMCLSACGDNDSSHSAVGGVAVDPYIVDAMFQEILADGTPGQTSTFSAEDGTFTFASPLAPDSTIRMIVGGAHNGIPFEGNFKTDMRLAGDSLVLSPLTSLLVNLMETGLSSEEAKAQAVDLFSGASLILAEDDLLRNPMGELSSDSNFEVLQAAMATNAFFLALERAGEDGYYITDQSGYLAHIENHQGVLINMLAAVRSSLRKESRDQIRNLAETGLGGGLPDGLAITDQDLIYASVAMMDFVAQKVGTDLKNDGVLDLNLETLVSVETLAELALHNFVARHLGEPGFAGFFQEAGIALPQVSVGATFSLDEFGSVQTASTPDNRPPLADAGEDQRVETGLPVILDGSGSDDADGDPLSYLWSFVSVPEGSAIDDNALSNPLTFNPNFVPDVPGTYELSLVVNDGVFDSRPNMVDIDVFSVNSPPVADAGEDQTVRTGIASYYGAFLDGSGSADPDGDVLTYSWTFASVPSGSTIDERALSDPSAVDSYFEPDIEGDYVLRLVVNDGESTSTPDEVIITAPPLCSPHDMFCGF